MIATPRERANTLVSWATETAWLAELAADSPRVTVIEAGLSEGGLPLNVIGIGYPAAPTSLDSTAGGALVVGFQHGMETSPREVGFHLARELAYTTDPDMLAYLTDRPVWIMPTANPDRAPYTALAEGGRTTLSGVDMNRDHIALASQQTATIHDVIRQAQPAMIVDMHEGSSEPNDLAVGGPTNPMVSTGARSWSDLAVTAILDELTGAGFVGSTWTSYPWPSMMRNAVALRHAVSIIIETTPQNRTSPYRIDVGHRAAWAALQFHAAHAADIDAALTTGRATALAHGGSGAAFTISGEIGGAVLDPAPIAYLIGGDDYEVVSAHLSVFGVEATATGGDWFVPMRQAAQPSIPYLLDETSEDAPVAAARIYARGHDRPLIAGVEPSAWGPIHLDGVSYEVSSVQLVRATED